MIELIDAGTRGERTGRENRSALAEDRSSTPNSLRVKKNKVAACSSFSRRLFALNTENIFTFPAHVEIRAVNEMW